MLPLCVLASSVELTFVGQTEHLSCGGMERKRSDWWYQVSEYAPLRVSAMNRTLNDDHNGRYTINGSSLIIKEVRASDAGIYFCGHGSQLYHKLQLVVNGL